MTFRQNLTWISLSAFATMGLTLAIFAPTSLTAVEQVKPATASIYTPTLTIGKINVVTQLAEKSGQADPKNPSNATIPVGAIPAMKLVITNTGDTQAEAKFVAMATVSSMRDMMSRAPRVRTPNAVEEYAVQLKAGESKTLDLKVPGEVEALGSVSIALVAGTKEVVTQTLSVRPNSTNTVTTAPANTLNAKPVASVSSIPSAVSARKIEGKLVANAPAQKANAVSQQAK